MPRNRPTTARDVFLYVKEHDIRFFDVKFVDLFGALQHLTLPIEEIDEGIFLNGLGLDGSSVLGFQEIDDSDLVMVPDPDTMILDPFFDDPTLSFFCGIVDPNGFKPYSRDSRGVALRAAQLVRSLGIADEAFFGPELEFFLFDDVRYDQATQHGFYFINNEGAFWNTGQSDAKNLGHRASRKRAYFAASPIDAYHNLRSKMCTVLRSVGVEAELHHHEVAAAGQNEIGYRFAHLTRAADNAVKFKYVIKNVAQRYGKSATFMPKPLFEENGSGMHTHVSLWKDGTNLFYDSHGYAGLSKMAIHFIGGLLHHAPALCAFCNPTTNSYRRLVPGYEAPINLAYSSGNRSACIRIPMSADSPKAKRIEYRTPDPSGNPYLAFSAILLAGLDGIRNQIEPPDPVEKNIYELAGTEEAKAIAQTPGSLAKALDALELDNDFLVADGVFSPALIETYVDYKRVHEIDFIRLRPHPGEFSLYFNV